MPRSDCAAYVFAIAASNSSGWCYLKATRAAYLGNRRRLPGHVLGRCAKSAPATVASMPSSGGARVAVCVVGQPRAGELTSPTIREHLLEPWRADAFVVSQLKDSRDDLARVVLLQ